MFHKCYFVLNSQHSMFPIFQMCNKHLTVSLKVPSVNRLITEMVRPGQTAQRGSPAGTQPASGTAAALEENINMASH